VSLDDLKIPQNDRTPPRLADGMAAFVGEHEYCEGDITESFQMHGLFAVNLSRLDGRYVTEFIGIRTTLKCSCGAIFDMTRFAEEWFAWGSDAVVKSNTVRPQSSL
jgi:hypothetical protein